MKLIALMQVRNEAHMLPYTLPPLARLCDHIIIADQHSTDDTRAIIKKFQKAILIDNNEPPPPKGRFDSARQSLLDAARNFDGNNLLLAIDADEIAPPSLFANVKETTETYQAGTVFKMRWFQLWGSNNDYRPPIAPPYHSPWQGCLCYDDRMSRYHGKWIHTGRFPAMRHKAFLRNHALLHLHWRLYRRASWQQVWYQMMEWKRAQFDSARVRRINEFYDDPLFTHPAPSLEPLPRDWLQGLSLPRDEDDDLAHHWRKDDVLAMIDTHGIAHFEPLAIWHLDELRVLFQKECGRDPVPHRHGYSLRYRWRVQKLRLSLLVRCRRLYFHHVS